jgi:hypothetical protein
MLKSGDWGDQSVRHSVMKWSVSRQTILTVTQLHCCYHNQCKVVRKIQLMTHGEIQSGLR